MMIRYVPRFLRVVVKAMGAIHLRYGSLIYNWLEPYALHYEGEMSQLFKACHGKLLNKMRREPAKKNVFEMLHGRQSAFHAIRAVRCSVFLWP